MCFLEGGGMGFRDMASFNVALLAKQWWRLINYSDSLFAQVIKTKYYPDSDFLNAPLGHMPSYTWKSIWVSRGVLQEGSCWRVGTGQNIFINDSAWIPNAPNFRLSTEVSSLQNKTVDLLIETNSRRWKSQFVRDTFPEEDAAWILRIPLAQSAQDDMLVWRAEPSGMFSVRSAYKLLQIKKSNPIAYAV